MTDPAFQQCINPACAATYAVDQVKVACDRCGGLLDVRYDWARLPVPKRLNFFEDRWATKGIAGAGRAFPEMRSASGRRASEGESRALSGR